ncbi:hypothetical protein [Helicobacter sp. 23-1045]
MDCFVVFATLKLPRNDGKSTADSAISQNLKINVDCHDLPKANLAMTESNADSAFFRARFCKSHTNRRLP